MKILIVQSAFLGDIILSTSVINAIKSLYPESSISYLTTPIGSQLVKNNPHIDSVLISDKRKTERGISGIFKLASKIRNENFDVVYSLHKSYRTSVSLFLSRIKRRVGFLDSKFKFLYTELVDRNMSLPEPERALSILSKENQHNKLESIISLYPEDSISQVISEDYVVIAPSSVRKEKRWDPANYNQIAKFLITKGYHVVFIGDSSESEIVNKAAKGIECTNLVGKTTISDCIDIINQAKLVVCNDSMPLHMASALKIPTIAIFCATSHDLGFGPYENKAIVVQQDHSTVKPLSSYECIYGLTTKSVMEAINSLGF